MQGDKTHEKHLEILERKDESLRPKDTQPAPPRSEAEAEAHRTNRENRDHNKHNDPGQSGHGPQRHTPAEEKH